MNTAAKVILSLSWVLILTLAVTIVTAFVQPPEHYLFACALTVAVAYLGPLWWIWK